jgi:hypothetical protein
VRELTKEELRELTDEATIDAQDQDEQQAGFVVMMDEHLELPFETTVLGVTVKVEKLTHSPDGIVADCVRDGHHQPISVTHLPLPDPAPRGAEWIAAYRSWARG